MTTTDQQSPTALEDEVEPPPSGAARRRRIFLVLLLVVALLAAGALVGGLLRAGPPKDTSVEAGFSRDMRTHHAQAVAMAMVEYQRSANPELRAVAYDVALTQQREIGMLDGWLTSWDLPLNSAAPSMSWMTNHASHAPATGTAGMPGMASPDELAKLNSASGIELDRMFLTMMIRHHQAGRDMAAAVLPLTDNELIRGFARRTTINQTAEIEQMQRYLQATPASG